MLNKKTVLIFIGLCSASLVSLAQNYLIKEFEGIYPGNNSAQTLGEILLSGYLKGEINAYEFAWRDTVLKSKRTTLPGTQEWEKGERYLIGDTVAYVDKYYVVEFAGKDWATVGIEPTSNVDEWMELSPYVPVSTGYLFPTIKDTLSKSGFLKRMVMRAPQSFSPWNDRSTYYLGDVVSFNGNNYECVSDDVVGASPGNENHWIKTRMGGMVFYPPRDLSEATILFHYTIQNRDTVWNPQVVTVCIGRNFTDMGKAMPVMHYYYHDVQNYLQDRFSPVFNVRSPAQAGEGIYVLTADVKANLLGAVKAKIKANQQAGKSSIVNKSLYRQWLADTASRYDADQSTYSVMQDLGGKTIALGRYNYSNNLPIPRPFLQIQAVDLAKWVSDSKPKAQYTFPEAAPRHEHLCCRQLTFIDSVAPPFNNTLIKPAPATRYFFMDKYTARLDSGHNSALAVAAPELWKLLMKAYSNKALRQSSSINFYISTYDWRKVGAWRLEDTDHTFDDTFQLDGSYRDYDELQLPNVFVALSVVYKKELTGTKWSFRPFQLTIYYSSTRSQDTGANESFAVYWTELEALMKNDKSTNIATFMKTINDGKVEFIDSEVVYGLMGAR